MIDESVVESAVEALDDSLCFRLDLLFHKLFDFGVHDSRFKDLGGHHAYSGLFA